MWAFILLIPALAWGYPETSRHGYGNCTTCHVSPSGGGLLTPYGRELSKELLSTWSGETEQYLAYGLLGEEDKLLASAFLRTLQGYRNTPTYKQARYIVMQADVEVGYNSEAWAIVGSIGRQEKRSGLSSKGQLFSRRHYAVWRPSETISLRGGKFLRNYGLNWANHNVFVRRELGFGFDTESYNLEANYGGENLGLSLTRIAGDQGDDSSYFEEKGWSASAFYYFLESQKVGWSLFKGKDFFQDRLVYGPWVNLAFTKQLGFMAELDWQNWQSRTASLSKNGYVLSSQLSYEIYKGIHPFTSFDRKRLNLKDPLSRQYTYGFGMQWFPRPHFEISGEWQKEVDQTTAVKSDLFWLMMYFYL